ncbi:hypothetical protein PINS_up007685 [Pythium insidiosum]|nr:hypothetical protein PINS_up007685 [Pythium insidiosum]
MDALPIETRARVLALAGDLEDADAAVRALLGDDAFRRHALAVEQQLARAETPPDLQGSGFWFAVEVPPNGGTLLEELCLDTRVEALEALYVGDAVAPLLPVSLSSYLEMVLLQILERKHLATLDALLASWLFTTFLTEARRTQLLQSLTTVSVHRCGHDALRVLVAHGALSCCADATLAADDYADRVLSSAVKSKDETMLTTLIQRPQRAPSMAAQTLSVGA